MTDAPSAPNTVYVVDDDEAVRESLTWLLEGNGFRVVAFESAEQFLSRWRDEGPAVLVADVRMPGMSGLELHDEIVARGSTLPVVLITGHGDVPMAVASMKKGAVDFLEKPFGDQQLCAIIREALARADRLDRERVVEQDAAQRLERLTQRERQVLERIVAGRLNKQIADDLDISIKTVEAHRASVMEKLGARTMADLMRIALRAMPDPG